MQMGLEAATLIFQDVYQPSEERQRRKMREKGKKMEKKEKNSASLWYLTFLEWIMLWGGVRPHTCGVKGRKVSGDEEN